MRAEGLRIEKGAAFSARALVKSATNISVVRLPYAGKFHVDVAAQAGIEEQVPAWMVIVVVDVDLVAIPLPTAAAVEIVRGNDPVGAVIEHDIARAVID